MCAEEPALEEGSDLMDSGEEPMGLPLDLKGDYT